MLLLICIWKCHTSKHSFEKNVFFFQMQNATHANGFHELIVNTCRYLQLYAYLCNYKFCYSHCMNINWALSRMCLICLKIDLESVFGRKPYVKQVFMRLFNTWWWAISTHFHQVKMVTVEKVLKSSTCIYF